MDKHSKRQRIGHPGVAGSSGGGRVVGGNELPVKSGKVLSGTRAILPSADLNKVRHAHYIKDNKANELPSQAIWFDTETIPVEAGPRGVRHVLDFIVAAYSRRNNSGGWTAPEYLVTKDAAEFFDWVEDRTRPKTRLYLYCHNTSFDLPVLDVFNVMPERGWQMKRAIIDAPPTIIDFHKSKCTIRILDTLNTWRMPLKDLGLMIDLPKLDMPDRSAPAHVWETYAKRDVEIIMRACLRWFAFIEDHDFGNYAPTLAGQALSCWRHKHMPCKVLAHDNGRVLEMEREAYHGGRTEPFFIGRRTGSFHLLDVTSMFPHWMKARMYPARLAFVRHNPEPVVLARYLPELACVARVKIATDLPIYGVVRDNRLVFPVGRFEAALAGPEILEAIARGHLEAVSLIAFYEPDNLFGTYIAELWAERWAALDAGDKVSAGFFKSLLVSLYGKFGQRGAVWEESHTSDDLEARTWIEHDVETGERRRWRQLAGLVQECVREPEARDSVPAIAAYVTSYARVHLWRLIEEAGRDNVLYCDTDSLLVTDAGRDRLSGHIAENTLGALKVEASYSEIEIWGPKDYRFGTTAKTKGVRKQATWIDAQTVQQEQWTSLKGILATGDMTAPYTKTVTKHLKREYTKGTVSPDGQVEPLNL